MGVPIPLDQPPPSPEAEAPAGPVGAPVSAGAAAITRGARRALAARGFVSLTEFRLPGGRRADLLAWDERGALLIVEVKSSVADFRSDHKWTEYREWCDGLFFAVDEAFPVEILPADCGLMVADPFGAAVLREPVTARLAPARRRGQPWSPPPGCTVWKTRSTLPPCPPPDREPCPKRPPAAGTASPS